MKLLENFEKGVFISRPNRFVLECRINRKKVRAYLPNPGRLRELLLPGSMLYLVRRNFPSPAYPYICVAVEKYRMPVMLHTHLNNAVAQHLIERGRIPGLEGSEIIRSEVAIDSSRFDFLLRHRGHDMVLEVKSCTLFGNTIAMFPDAVTLRGKRHLEELASLSGGKRRCAVLFIVHAPGIRHFLPDYHTDLAFSQTLLSVSRDIMVKAVAVSWGKDLLLAKTVQDLRIPWETIRTESQDSGSYILILRLKKDEIISVGSLGAMRFRKGYYLYAGSARKNLSQRIARHQRKRKNLFWHIDHVRHYAEHCSALPVRASADLECEIASALDKIAERNIPGFGASDCRCSSHLFFMQNDPNHSPQFMQLLLDFRINRLEELLS